MLAAVLRADWPSWEARLSAHEKMTARQLLHSTYGFMLKDRDAKGREEINAMLERREPLDLETGRPEGYKSDDPVERTRARIAMMEERRKEREADG